MQTVLLIEAGRDHILAFVFSFDLSELVVDTLYTMQGWIQGFKTGQKAKSLLFDKRSSHMNCSRTQTALRTVVFHEYLKGSELSQKMLFKMHFKLLLLTIRHISVINPSVIELLLC